MESQSVSEGVVVEVLVVGVNENAEYMDSWDGDGVMVMGAS